MENVKNLQVQGAWEDGAYGCTIDLLDEWNNVWEKNVQYTARAGDPAPVNKWILEQIATGQFDPVPVFPQPPLPPNVPSDGPAVL